MRHLAEVIAEMEAYKAAQKLAPDWHTTLPRKSLWEPGSPCKPDCPRCLGAGYLRLDVPYGHPQFGKLVICPNAENELEMRQWRNLAGHSTLPFADLRLRFDSIVPLSGHNAHQAAGVCQSALGRGAGWVYLWGANGVGKTMLLKAAVAESIAAQRLAIYANWSDVLAHLRSGFKDDTYDERLESWRSAPLLCLDEFGRANDTGWVREQTNRILSDRYVQASERRSLTIFASNDSPDLLEPWLASRLRDGRFTVLELTGADVRPALE